MDDSAETVHVAFGWSIPETLREALPLLGSEARVIGLPDILSVGPIDPPDPFLRQAWGKAVLRADPAIREGLVGDPAAVERAWNEAIALETKTVFWVCTTSPMEHACFLAFAAARKGRLFEIVDAADLDFTTADDVRSPSSLGLMRAQDIVASNLYAKRRLVSLSELQAAALAWSQLRQENAPFRVLTNGRLVSAPLTFYDSFLVEQAGRDWEIVARLLGRIVTKLSFENVPPGQATSDVVLFGRVLALAEAGALEIAGAGPGMRDYEVRRGAE